MKRRSSPKPTSEAHDARTLQPFIDAVEDYGIFMLDAEGRVLTWNRGAEKIKGYRASEIVGRHFSTFYPPEDVASDKPGRELAVARRDGRIEDEGFRVRKDGSLFWANVVITALFDSGGELVGFTKVTRDLTARRAAEDELRRSEERFRLLVESVTDYAMYMLDVEGRVTTWNRGAEKMKGFSAGEIIGRHFSCFFPEEELARGKPEHELAVALRDGRFEEEGTRVRKDGSRFWANVTLTPIRDARGELLGFAKVTRDLTERVEAERVARELARESAARAAAERAEAQVREAALRAEQAAARAEQASRMKDDFLATVSHELRTPLNAIVGWSTLLRTRNQEPALIKGLDVIYRNALAQGRIIDDILDVSSIITGRLRLDIKPTDLVELTREAFDVIAPAATGKNLELALHAPERDCRLLADPERIRQVLWNLLSNATKFSEPGATIDVTITHEASSLVLSVRDSGRGIESSFLPFVFDRFRQADSSPTRNVGGLGLGLAIVRHLVELHGGQVEAASEGLGKGATFTVRLPVRTVVPSGERELPVRTPLPSLPASAGERLVGARVLVVDDDADARELVMTVLAGAGASVEVASSAGEGFERLTRFRPHVLISDISMPGEDGYALIQRVRALPPELGGRIPSVALTAYARVEDKARSLALGFTTHLGKPVHPDDLVTTIANLAALFRA